MASRKKQSEGIALLSMYNDEDDEDMEDLDDQQQQHEEQQQQHEEDELLEDQNDYRESNETGPDSVNDAMVTDDLPNETSEHLETSQPIEMNNTVIESEAVENEGTTNVLAEDDSLDKFLPPPSKDKCPEELQRKIDKFLALKKVGRSFNAEVRNRKDYRNPDFLLHAVRYQDIDQIGSCFSKDVFDPHGYDKSDFYDEIEADMRREKERKEQELKKSPKVEFISGGTQPAQVAAPPKFSLPIPVAAPSGLHSASTTADAVVRDGRQNKKSKWDKVDGDGKNLLPTGGQDSLTTVAAHAALLSAANVGAGYTAFVQQKRREAEEKRSSEKKLERRS
ncbi:hypothetical protein P3X46_033136 [Hevea brasiliensis]|uniref:SAP30-binding protein n=1 Tax=Hevea brasiliensis TaxID=3981 RepID=A0ABQ9KFI1_HEVBR|nr:uncharacterized protein LOC110652589 [Hevea brasiliensis]KAJ9136020.1 hypothetical protein P3X46_033136 [Hevea brasiliensis]